MKHMIGLSKREFEFLLNHLVTYAQVDMNDPIEPWSRDHFAVIDTLLAQAPNEIITKVISKNASPEFAERLISEQIERSDERKSN
jgi:hypothetical protein